jgi:probable rRNA maturation factor
MMEPGSPDPASAGIRLRQLGAGTRRGASLPTVIVLDAKWRGLVPRAERVAARAAAAAGGAGTVVLSSDRAVKALNGKHRKRNKPTNVLTFEFGGTDGGFLGGDIVLALGTVRREAAAAHRPAAHHLAHLVVHGALHLRGHDHHHPGEARRMEMAEARILSGLGVPNPWKRR